MIWIKFHAWGGVASPEVLKVLEWVKSQLGKADQVVEEWHEGANFFRKYASGFIEQGGKTDNSGLTGITQTLHVPFSSATYVIQLSTIIDFVTEGGADYIYPADQTTSSFKCVLAGGYAYWYACGY